MGSLLLSILVASSLAAAAPPDPPSSLRGVLLEQLKTTHNNKDWFAPASAAVDDSRLSWLAVNAGLDEL